VVVGIVEIKIMSNSTTVTKKLIELKQLHLLPNTHHQAISPLASHVSNMLL